MNKKKVLLIGSGFMAREYLRVLRGIGVNVIVVGRSEKNIQMLQNEYPEFEYYIGGLQKFIDSNLEVPEYAINAVSIDQLKNTTLLLIDAGVKNILIEKPGAMNVECLVQMSEAANKKSVQVKLAYNRRFYTSVYVLQKEILLDGGIISAHFEFTEWVHTINPSMYDPEALKKWIISNSSHVIDTAFYLIGIPNELHTIVKGKNVIDWHPSGSIFIGTGITVADIPFTYHSNWESPGRWSIEISTQKRRFYLKPMEKLQQQLKGSVQITDVEIDDDRDREYKAGLFLQTHDFLKSDFSRMISLDEQARMLPLYYSIGGYE